MPTSVASPQVVLEIIEDQVKRGSRIYERDHVRGSASLRLLCSWPLGAIGYRYRL